LNNENGRIIEITASRVEQVAADIESVVIDTKRIVIAEVISIGTTYGILLDKKVGPNRVCGNHAIAGGIRDGKQHPVWKVGISIGAGTWKIEHLQEPPFRKPVVPNLWIRRVILDHRTCDRGHDATKETVKTLAIREPRIDLKHAVGKTSGFVEAADPSVNENDELSRTGRAHGIRRKRAGVERPGYGIPVQTDRLRKIWARDLSGCRGGALFRCAGSNLWIVSRRRILWPAGPTGDLELAFDERVFSRPCCRLFRHNLSGASTNAFLTGLRLTHGVALVGRHLAKTANSEKY